MTKEFAEFLWIEFVEDLPKKHVKSIHFQVGILMSIFGQIQ